MADRAIGSAEAELETVDAKLARLDAAVTRMFALDLRFIRELAERRRARGAQVTT